VKDDKGKQVRDNERKRKDTYYVCTLLSSLCRISGWPKSLAERTSPISAIASKASPSARQGPRVKPPEKVGPKSRSRSTKGRIAPRNAPAQATQVRIRNLSRRTQARDSDPTRSKKKKKKSSGCRGLGRGAFEVLDAHPSGRGGGKGIGRNWPARVELRTCKFKLHHSA
jgi:hypothetical protein